MNVLDQRRLYNHARRERRRRDGRGIVASWNARRKILALLAAGASQRSIARATWTTYETINRIVRGKRKRISSGLESRLFALSPKQCESRRFVDARRTRAIIAELSDLGYTKRQLAKWLGFAYSTIYGYGAKDKVTARFAEAVEQLKRRIEAGKVRRQ